jgi:hypothetical protein
MPVGKHMGHINILLLFFGAIQFNCSESLITIVVNGVWRLSLDIEKQPTIEFTDNISGSFWIHRTLMDT